jgi:hypothetical protein
MSNEDGYGIRDGEVLDHLLVDAFHYLHSLINSYHDSVYGDHCDPGDVKTEKDLPCLRASVNAASLAFLVTCYQHYLGRIAITGDLGSGAVGRDLLEKVDNLAARQRQLIELDSTPEDVVH